MTARKHLEGDVDLGQVGEVAEVHPAIIDSLVAAQYIPVIAPVAQGEDGVTYNINADHVAGHLAAALHAAKLILLTDVRGVLADKSDPESLVSVLTASEAGRMVATGQIESGMLPKVAACLDALGGGVPRTHIIDGTLPHALLMEILTDVGIGTMVTA
jgi:acetylglutamate kinase